MVSTLKIALSIINLVIGFALPLAAVIYLKVKYHLGLKAFAVGAGVMLVFALTLEQGVHSIVLTSPIGAVIQNNLLLYALYGGLMAGIFEECGRLIGMHYFLKEEQKEPRTALMFGAGHGGFECAMILGTGMLNQILYAFMINNGQAETVLASLDPANQAAVSAVFNSLISTPAWQYLLAPWERISAFAAQIGLSVIVWYGVTHREKLGKYLGMAIGLHALMDGVSVIIARIGVPLVLVELLISLMAAGICWIAWKIRKTENPPQKQA